MNEESPPPISKLPLSLREKETLDLLISGLTNKQIAIQLGISEKMVEKHLAHIYQKANTHCRAGAVAWALNQKNNG